MGIYQTKTEKKIQVLSMQFRGNESKCVENNTTIQRENASAGEHIEGKNKSNKFK